MSLTAEQRAVLDLAVGRGLEPAAIAAMTGLSDQAVRDRLRAAVSEIGGGDPGPDVTAVLLGHADDAQRHAATARLRRDRASRARVEQITSALQVGWPDYRPPTLAGADRSRPGAGPWSGWALGGAVLVAAVLVILVAVGTLGGGDEPATPGGAVTAAQPSPVRVALRSPDDGVGRGTATLGTTPRFESYLDLEIASLASPPRGRVYLLWVDDGRGRGLPIPAPVEPDGSGPFTRRYGLSDALAPVLARSRRIELLVVGADRLATLLGEVERLGGSASSALPRRPGEVVLRGTLPTRPGG